MCRWVAVHTVVARRVDVNVDRSAVQGPPYSVEFATALLTLLMSNSLQQVHELPWKGTPMSQGGRGRVCVGVVGGRPGMRDLHVLRGC